MREILFRGKTDDGEWVYGSFCMDAREQFNGLCGVDGFIRLYDKAKGKMQTYEVDRETVGQYTGLIDKNGKRIFDGDIIAVTHEEDRYPVEGEFIYCENGKVYFDETSFGWYVKFVGDALSLWEFDDCDVTIIGNIHDNPELLEK